jgi:hypothetical protein
MPADLVFLLAETLPSSILKELRFNGSFITPSCLRAFTSALPNCPHLRSLDFGSCSLPLNSTSNDAAEFARDKELLKIAAVKAGVLLLFIDHSKMSPDPTPFLKLCI